MSDVDVDLKAMESIQDEAIKLFNEGYQLDRIIRKIKAKYKLSITNVETLVMLSIQKYIKGDV